MFTSTHKRARGALKLFFVFSLLEGLAPIYPVYAIMFADRGYDLTAFSFLLSIWALPVVILELPSGILADRWSKKGVVAIGMVMKALCFILWTLSPAFWVAALGFVFWGCQEAFCSGALQALMYEALKDEGLEGEYEKAIGLSGALEMAAIVVSEIAGAAIYALSPLLALGLSSVSAVAAAITALVFHEKKRSWASSEASAIFAGLKKCLTSKYLVPLLATACLAGAAYGTIDEFDALWATERYGVPVAFVGMWGALRLALQGLGGLLSGHLPSSHKTRLMGTAFLLAGILFVISAFLPGWWGIPIYFVFYFIMEAVSVLFEGRLQEAADDALRASLLSFASLLLTLFAVLLSPFLGLAGDLGGFKWIIAICGGLTAVSGAILIPMKCRDVVLKRKP